MDPNKKICFCKNVTVKNIEDAIENGATSFYDIQSITKLGTGCKGCVNKWRPFIEEAIENGKFVE